MSVRLETASTKVVEPCPDCRVRTARQPLIHEGIQQINYPIYLENEPFSG